MKTLILTLTIVLSGYCSYSQSQIVTTGNNVINTSSPYVADVIIGSDASGGTRHDASIMWWSNSSASRISNSNDIFYYSVWNTASPNIALGATLGANSYFLGKVGIGTPSPGNLLDVNGVASFGNLSSTGTQLLVRGGTSGSSMLTLLRSGTAPAQFSFGLAGGGLSVRDDNNSAIVANLFATPTTNSFYIGQMGTVMSDATTRNSLISATTVSSSLGSNLSAGSLTIQSGLGTGTGTPGDIFFSTGNRAATGTTAQSSAVRITIKADSGFVGIGTTRPREALSVNGNICSKQVKVEIINWPDYVFTAKYKIASLSQVKRYIDKNQHLPEMPSEKEVARNGVNLGEIAKVQTKKIEELTLYLIEKDKQVAEQREQNKRQDKRITALEKALSKLTSSK
jgi:hypothetical protein